MSAKHTPGPWRLVGPDEFGDYTVNTESDPTAIAAVVNGNWLSMGGLTDRHAANASLIAAAPDLLKVAKRLDAWWTERFPEGPEGDPVWDGGLGKLSEETLEIWSAIRSALAKAEGRS